MALADVLDRVKAAQPETLLSNHEGYYRHDDVNAMVVAIGIYGAAMKRVADLAENMTIHHEDALAMIAALAKAQVK